MIRFSIRFLMATLALLGLAIASVQWNLSIFASLAFTVMVAAWALGLVGALCQRGEQQVYWIGFTVCLWLYAANSDAWTDIAPTNRAWSYNISGLINYRSLDLAGGNSRPPLLTDFLIERFVRPRPKVGDTVSAQWNSGSYYDAVVQDSKDGLYLVDWIDSSPDSWVRLNQINIITGSGRQTSHAIVGLLVAIWGGTIARTLFPRRETPDKKATPA